MGFPKKFLWGGDISATQIEGAWNEGGKSPVEPDYYLGGNKDTLRYAYYRDKAGNIGKVRQYSGQLPKGAEYIFKNGEIYPNHFASDFYHHYQEDISLLGEMGFKALNLTISWARILPNGIRGGLNKEGLDFYKNVVSELKKYDIEPIVTMYKYDMPAFFVTECGGWSNRQLIDEFVAFNEICMNAFKDDVKYWITFNEINVLIALMDSNPNLNQQDKQRIFEETHHQFLAAAKVVKMGHEINSNFKIGCMVASTTVYPMTPDPDGMALVQKFTQDKFFYFADTMIRGGYPSYSQRIHEENQITLDICTEDKQILLEGKADFLAFSYYMSNCLTTHMDLYEVSNGNVAIGGKNPYLESTEWGWQIDAKGLKYTLHQLYDRYNVPLLIVENGIGAVDKLEEDGSVHDDYRIDYHKKHIQKIKEAIEEGVDLLGYTMWSCIDLVSFSTGELRKRYGFVYVDVDDHGKGSFNRYRKDSFYWYKMIIESNGEKLY
ncbi:glycoside hydrolase family 1 protein [Streptococcus merionis]|uniref:glycoside hydrolase family 1 protein n=1 Tax=Streptococcus merionis TaxID=400065 RepID=UPI0026F194F3|nr:glycoside hydrolase family 1 protein [Streptococcus merionis]